jgi:predicted amidophosphoribosyltransferase
MVYAPQYYIKYRAGPDSYSHDIVLSKRYVDYSDHFLGYFENMYKGLKEDNVSVAFDLITVMPSSKKGYLSKTLSPLATKISEKTGVPVCQILERTRDVTSSGSNELSLPERFQKIKGSIAVIRNLKENEKRILVLDDTKASGCSILEAASLLKNAGAVEVVLWCLGINKYGWKYG